MRASDRASQFVSFILEKRMYGFDIDVVKEVNPNTDITTVPRSEPYIRGLVNIRGQVVLVMDIAVIFGREPRPVTVESQVVILKTAEELARTHRDDPEFDVQPFGDKPVCFLVDRIGDVVTAAASEIEPPPSHLKDRNVRHVRGVVNRGGELVVVLNAGEILASRKSSGNALGQG